MRTRASSLVLLLAAGLITAGAFAPSAAAAEPNCYAGPSGEQICEIQAVDPGQPGATPVGNPTQPGSGSESGGGDGDGGETAPPGCTSYGNTIPCTAGGGTWNPGQGCYLTGPISPAEAGEPWLSEAADPAREGQALYRCLPPPPLPNVATYVWTGGAAAPIPVVDPEVLARQAIEQMTLSPVSMGTTPPTLGTDPQSLGLVGMYTYLWVADLGPTTWGPVTETASAGAVTVSATATVDNVVWDMGDGRTVTCTTTGTPWTSGRGRAPSPDCGHVYTQTSSQQPDQAYTVTATTNWSVEWAGGGQSGTISFPLTATDQLRIGESQVIVTRGDG